MSVGRPWLKAASEKGAGQNIARAKHYNAKFRVEIDRLIRKGSSFKVIAGIFNDTVGLNRLGRPWSPQSVHALYRNMSLEEAYEVTFLTTIPVLSRVLSRKVKF